MSNVRNALFIGAHPDDIELGCGGTIAKLTKQGVNCEVIILSRGQYGADEEQYDRLNETRRALQYLGVSQFYFGDFEDTRMYLELKEIIVFIEQCINRGEPFDRVYTMFDKDSHQDHRTVYAASIVACRGIKQILQYETPSSWPNFMPVVYEEIDPVSMNQKTVALRMHESQAHREYTQEDALRVSSKFRGQQVRLGPCEGFIPYKLVL